MYIGQSDAGKTFWTDPLIIPDLCGQVITSADFMWQECTGKDLILVPELTLSKYDQVEGFKKISEDLPTMVNVKNKPAVLLQRTPMLVTTNTYPWKFFNDEEEAIKNRMFFHEVKKYDWNNPKSPNPKFFCNLFKSIGRFVDGDEFFPYDMSDDEHYPALYEAIANQIKSLSILKIDPHTSPVHQAKFGFSDKHVFIPWAAPKVPERFWEKLRKGDDDSLVIVKHILMCFSDDTVNLYCHWNEQDKLEYVDLDRIDDCQTASTIWAFLERCIDELSAFKGPVYDGMSSLQRNMKKYLKMLDLLMNRAIYLMANAPVDNSSPDILNPPPPKRVKFSPEVASVAPVSYTATPTVRRTPTIQKQSSNDERGRYVKNLMRTKDIPATDTHDTSDDTELCDPSSTANVVEDGTCEGCRLDRPGQRSHMGPGGCLENPTVINNETCEGCRLNLPGQRAHMGIGGCLEVVEEY